MEDEKPIKYTEEEAAKELGMSPRTLADYRRAGRLKGNYAVLARNVLYTPEHLRAIINIFTVGRKNDRAA